MFRCSDTTFVTFENRKFLFSRLTLFLLYLYSVFKVHPDFFKPVSGDNEIRTRDPLLARQVLSQLSYIPRPHKMGSSGLEPPTSRLSGVRSNQLSYKPILKSFDFSGDEEIRTLDPLLARQVLSQLSYIPI